MLKQFKESQDQNSNVYAYMKRNNLGKYVRNSEQGVHQIPSKKGEKCQDL